ncbi:P1 family peptidase [Ectobacillus sp. JY-23]|uniref:DmpA family aminopeptidase n=1 Tax=Ectobacillus sp. JY-23 TaxID=2933872 RepID=UPI001FF698E7|nr:P1 family peptidase [Ectobacillus sp. JY-23]UOY91861.1 P1 family peptidase [Ectobacillus sp. JY-23]
MKKERIREYGIKIGRLQPGSRNAITDVEGITVGHVTLSEGDMQTGVTAIVPHQGNIFREKLVASSHVINGVGKTLGTIQIEELGTLETPIVLTNTLSVGIAADALIEYMLDDTPEIGRTTGSVNPVVCECNDMLLNDIRAGFVTKEHVLQALRNTSVEVEEGAVGAGTGMLCYSLKGGIGTASRMMEMEHGTYTMGVLILTNFGILSDLRVDGKAVGEELRDAILHSWEEKDKGSVIIIVATDLPVSERQLKRIIKRTVVGLSRTGSIITTGSGEVVIGFSTANTIPHQQKQLRKLSIVPEDDLDVAFRAISEATEEAVLNALIAATPVVGRDKNERPALYDLLQEYGISLK